ncbi:hypothetical protein UFOVP252_23 [uncultured Caudovirales phage]|uniref:Uncharacterized protein n=1 Tax=uncultured Caudovirales phage TaxID=2100421 RepID=A0A6J5LIU2_9CAUD|nr:hypothetical protein UFOVP252_23 [uncultured Caudovirales phage]
MTNQPITLLEKILDYALAIFIGTALAWILVLWLCV